jgi:hypothetical protein
MAPPDITFPIVRADSVCHDGAEQPEFGAAAMTGGALMYRIATLGLLFVLSMLALMPACDRIAGRPRAVPFCLPVHDDASRQLGHIGIAISRTDLAMRKSSVGSDRYLIRSVLVGPQSLQETARMRQRRQLAQATGDESSIPDDDIAPKLLTQDETAFFRAGAVIEFDVATGELRRATNADWDAAEPTIYDDHRQRSDVDDPRPPAPRPPPPPADAPRDLDRLMQRYGGPAFRPLQLAHEGRMIAVATFGDNLEAEPRAGFDPSKGVIRPYNHEDPETFDDKRIYIQFYDYDTRSTVGCLTRCQRVSVLYAGGTFASIRTPDDQYLLVVSAEPLSLKWDVVEVTVSAVRIPEPAKVGVDGAVGKE